jgi:membrane protease YdiL (CAAX protease family)
MIRRRETSETCLGVAVVIVTCHRFALRLIAAGPDGSVGFDTATWVGAGSFLLTTLVLVLVVPLQAVAEEYVFRGWLLQAFGSVFRRPWVPILIQAVLFAALHGEVGMPLAFGVLAGWLTVRTGGIEAAIGLHIAHNLFNFVIAGATGGLGKVDTAGGYAWLAAVLHTAMFTIYALVVLRLARRTVAVRSSSAPAPTSVSA